jgi:hypothetical protein
MTLVAAVQVAVIEMCGFSGEFLLSENRMSEEGSRHSSDAPGGASGAGNASGAAGNHSGGTRNNVVVKIGMVGDAQVNPLISLIFEIFFILGRKNNFNGQIC